MEDNNLNQNDMHQEHASQQQESHPQREDVCRDFLKNICNRGSRCKFYHPADATRPNAGGEEFNFCIDFQNRGCDRRNCRFVHAPRDQVERYKQTRELTLPLVRAIAAVGHGDTIGGIPVCKEFQNGGCVRGANRCRYWHVNVDLEKDRRIRGLPPSSDYGPPRGMYDGPMGPGAMPPPFGGPLGAFGPPRRRRANDDYEMDAKRSKASVDQVHELEKKNAELQKEIDSLKRELQREHERYEDLYALFRQQTSGAPAPPKAPPSNDYYGGWTTAPNGASGAHNW